MDLELCARFCYVDRLDRSFYLSLLYPVLFRRTPLETSLMAYYCPNCCDRARHPQLTDCDVDARLTFCLKSNIIVACHRHEHFVFHVAIVRRLDDRLQLVADLFTCCRCTNRVNNNRFYLFKKFYKLKRSAT